MKEGWTYKKFGEVCSYHKEQGSFQNLPYVGMEHMESCTGKLLGTISSNSVLSSSFKFNKGEILYGRLRPYLKKVYVAEFDGCCSTEVFPINSDSIEAGFIKYWFLSDKITNMVNKTSAGCRMPRGNMNEVKNFLIGFPEDRKEQKRIVKRLDAAFENIDKLKANAEKQLAEAQNLFKRSLAKAMEPKEGWDSCTFDSITKKYEVGLVKSLKEQAASLRFPYIKMGNMTNFNVLDLSNIVYVDALKEEVERFRLEKNDFLFNTRNSRDLVGKTCVFNEEGLYLYNNNIARIRFDDCVDPSFINYLFLTNTIKDQLDKIKKGTTNVWAIYYKELKNILVPIPPLAEQQRIVERLDALSENIRKYEEIQRQIISECDALKQALLRKVFE